MKNIFVLFLVLMITFVGCTDKFEDFNTDKKNPAVVSGNGLFTNAQKELSDQVNETSVNLNNWKLWSQYWTETTYVDEANYDIVTRNVPKNVYGNLIRQTLKDLDESYKLISEEVVVSALEGEKANRLAIIELLNVYVYQRLVDVFGMSVYTEILNVENVYPKYDGGKEIYMDILSRADAALADLDASSGSFGSADLYYGGDVASWIQFGNTLKVRLGITIADSDDALAKTTIESAVAAGCFASMSDDCLMPYSSSSPNQNPLYENLVASGRDDFVPANTLVDVMNGLDDPRMDAYFSNKIEGEYLGGPYGYTSPYAQYSHVSSRVIDPTFPGFILTFTELQFYLAEAAQRGYAVGGTADSFYEAGIASSFEFWGSGDATAYIAANAYDAANWKEVLGTQSWLASYTRGFVAYTTWRRLDYPEMNLPETLEGQGSEGYAQIPVRFTFPIEEQTLNEDSYKAAAEAVGGDLLTTKIFWDVFDSPFAK